MNITEYFAIERDTDYRNEYYAGDLVELNGDTWQHAKLVANLSGQVALQTRRTGNQTFAGGLRIRGNAQHYLYGDLTIVCGEAVFKEVDHLDTLVNPSVIFEILSDSTERRDRGVKWHVYRQIDSLKHYVMISQWGPCVEVYTRQEDGDWVLHTVTDPEGSFSLSTVDVTIAIADLYEGVPVEPEPSKAEQ